MIRSLNKLQPWGLMLLRVALGVAMLYHGYAKLIPPGGLHQAHPLAGLTYYNHYIASLGLPYWMGYLSVAAEFLGGAFLIAGLLTRFWGFAIAVNMLVAIWKVDLHHGYAGSEYSVALLTMALMLVVAGSGALAVDRRFGLS